MLRVIVPGHNLQHLSSWYRWVEGIEKCEFEAAFDSITAITNFIKIRSAFF
jgi:hypothetical protein